MKHKDILIAFSLAFGTFILGGIIIDIVKSNNESINIIQAILYLAAVVAFWGYLLYRKIDKN